jgi:hypothetical protein
MYFYLKWYDRRPETIILTNDKPQKINFSNTFKIKDKEYVICGDINPNFKRYFPPVKLQYSKNQYLLSHLQKSVRRMDSHKSVQTAKHLLDLDMNSFLRRLPIIMLEDVTIHESFPVLIWLMIAFSKKFEMKYEIVKWLLGVVYHLSLLHEKTYYENKDIKEIDIKEKHDIFLETLRFRKAYGGMKGDMNMIEYYTQLLYHKKIVINNEKISLIKCEMEPLLKKDWIYQANDFHCNRTIPKVVKRYFPKYSEEYIKELIWNFSSSQNNRIEIINDKKQAKDWEIIKKHVKKIQKSCIFY